MELTKRFALAALVLMAFAAHQALANDVADIKDTIKKSFAVDRGGTMSLDLDRGNVEIRRSSESMVYVEVERTVDAESKEDAKRILAEHELEIYKKGNNVVLRSRHDNEGRGWRKWHDKERLKLRVVVRIPSDYNVDFTTGAGNVDVDDVDGEVEGTTGAGNIKIGVVTGRVRVTSGSGNVDIDGAEGPVEVNTGAGNVSVGEVGGEVVANTGAGNITATIARQPSSRSKLETGAGNVTVYLSRNVGMDVNAATGLGSADCDFGLKVEGKWMSKSFKGAVNGGGPALTMRSGVGNVRLKRQ